MSSSAKLPSGLNNWEDGDKPERMDFVTDNEILDQNVLWKDDYDAVGVVAQSGGIEAYAMYRDTYDPAGSVAAAGGIMDAIQSAVSGNEGYSLYLHSKSGNVHTLTNSAGGSVIRFVATADFEDGDIFVVNGTACAANTIDGTLIEGGFFVTGTVVSCFLNGAQLNFRGGGGSRLNYSVVGGTSQPAAPKENTIWINTAVTISGYIFQPAQPTAHQGRVWIQINFSAPVVTSNLIKSPLILGTTLGREMIRLPILGIQIYNNSTWVNVNAHMYENGVWTQVSSSALTIYNGGASVSNMGTLTSAYARGLNATTSISGGVIKQQAQRQTGITNGAKGDYGSTPVNLTNFTTLTVNVAAVAGSPYSYQVGFISNTTNATWAIYYWNFSNWVAQTTYTAAGVKTIDISALTGNYYFAMSMTTKDGYDALTYQNISSIVLS